MTSENQLLNAIKANDLHKTKAIIDHLTKIYYFNINKKYQELEGRSILLYAAYEECSAELVGYLIDRGANVNQTDDEENTALHLIAYGDPIHHDAIENQINIMKVLVKSSIDINAKNIDDDTALDITFFTDNHKAIYYLKSIGAKSQTTENDSGNSIFHQKPRM
jgi:ankyrin repeat protein